MYSQIRIMLNAYAILYDEDSKQKLVKPKQVNTNVSLLRTYVKLMLSS